jgi:hypothetical protein
MCFLQFQEYTKSLGARAVAYVNVDYAFDGLYFFFYVRERLGDVLG